MSWSILEAVLNRVKEAGPHKIRTPGQVVQKLEMEGLLGPETGRKLRGLSELRNRIVHGDFDADASGEDVKQVLAAINEVLVEEVQ